MGWMEKRQAKPGQQQRAAGTKKTALFDIVNRTIAATHSVLTERTKERAVTHQSRVPAKRAPRRRFCARRRYARASRDPGATERDLRALMLRLASCAGSRVSLRSPGTRERSTRLLTR